MATGNYLVDMGLQEELKTDVNKKEAPYFLDINNLTQESPNVPKRAEQEIDLASFGLESMEEYQLMVDVKNQGGSGEDFREILNQTRQQKTQTFTDTVKQETLTQQLATDPISKGIATVGTTVGTGISEFGKKAKFFQSEVDDNIIESGLKFFGNLPGNTLQLAGDLISVAADPIGTITSVRDLAKAGIETGLNKMFMAEGEEVFTSPEVEQMADAVGAELAKLGEPGRIKELLVENPADVLLTITGGLGVAKNVARSKGFTELATKIEKAENLANPIKIQAEAIKGVGTVIGKGTERVSEKLLSSTLKFTPTQTSKTSRAAGKSPSKWLFDKGIIDDASIVKGKEGIVSKLQEFNTNSYNKLNDTVAKVEGKFKNKFVDEGLSALVKEFSDVPGMETKFNKIKDLQLKAARGEGLSLTEVLSVKREMDNALDLFKVTGDIKAGATKEGLGNIRRGIREFIEAEAETRKLPDIKQLSNDVRVSRMVKDNLINRIEAGAGTRTISLTDIIVGGGAFAGTDLGTTVAILAGKKILESAPFKLFATKTLRLPKTITNKLNRPKDFTPKESFAVGNAVKEYIATKGAKIADELTGKAGVEVTKEVTGKAKGLIDSKTINTKDEAQVTDLFTEYRKNNEDETGVVIDSDEIKKMFSDFDPKKPELVHKPSSQLSQIFYEKSLAENPSNKVVLTAGGGGSGKSEVLIRDIKTGDPAIVFDGTGKNFDKMVGNYDKAIAAGKNAQIDAVFIDFNTAKRFNELRERTVPLNLLEGTHKGYRQTLLRMLKERSDIPVNLTINTGVRNAAGKAITEKIPQEDLIRFLEAKQELE